MDYYEMANAETALNNWRNNKRFSKRPVSIWGLIIVLCVLIGLVGWLFFGSSQKNNWSVFKSVPSDQSQQVKSVLKKFALGFEFPTDLPFTPTSAYAKLSNTQENRVLTIDFSNGQSTIEERVSNDGTSPLNMQISHPQNVTLPNGTSAVFATREGFPELLWTQQILSYGLMITQWHDTNRPTTNQLIHIYEHMTSIDPLQ